MSLKSGLCEQIQTVSLTLRGWLERRNSRCLRYSVVSPKARGRNAEETAHVHGEMTRVGKTDLQRDLWNRQASTSKQEFGTSHASFYDVLVYGLANGNPEGPLAMGDTQPGDIRNQRQRKVFTQVVFNEGQHAPQPHARHAPGDWCCGLLGSCAMGVEQSRGQRSSNAVRKELSTSMRVIDFALKRPTQMFNSRVPNLKAVQEFRFSRIDLSVGGQPRSEDSVKRAPPALGPLSSKPIGSVCPRE